MKIDYAFAEVSAYYMCFQGKGERALDWLHTCKVYLIDHASAEVSARYMCFRGKG